MAKNNVTDWDTTAGNNTDVGGINIDEGWAPESVNNAARETMAQLAAFHGDVTGKLTSGGAANAYTLTTNDGIAVPAAGQLYVFIANHANTGAATLAVNAGAAKSIVRNHDVELLANDIEANQLCVVMYEATDDTYQLMSQLGNASQVTLGTSQTATGVETSFTFSGIPAWAKTVEVLFNGVSLSGTVDILVQLGTSGGIVTTGYTSTGIWAGATDTVLAATSTSGFVIGDRSAANDFYGSMSIKLIDTNEWVSDHVMATGAFNFVRAGGGAVSLGGQLTQLRVTSSGVDTFDNNGKINVRYF